MLEVLLCSVVLRLDTNDFENGGAENPSVVVNMDQTFDLSSFEPHVGMLSRNGQIDRVQIRSKDLGGQLRDGLFYEGYQESGMHSFVYPHTIIVDDGDVVKIIPGQWELTHRADKYFVMDIQDIQFIEVLTPEEYQQKEVDLLARLAEQDKQEAEQRGITNIIIPYSQAEQVGEPGGGAFRDQIYFAFIQGMKFPFDRLLLIDGLTFQLEIEWTSSVGLAAASVGLVPRSWASVRTRLEAVYLGADQDSWESAFQANFPPAATISYNKLNSTGTVVTTTTDTVWLTPLQDLTLFGVQPATDPLIMINPTVAWDYDPRDGVDDGTVAGVSAKYDLAGALAHELGHHLGFVSRTSFIHNTNTLNEPIRLLDVFRFNRVSGSPPAVTPANMRNETRELRRGASAVVPVEINNAAMMPCMSTGVPFSASHWCPQPLVSGHTGMMIPAVGLGANFWIDGTVIRENDARAIDLIGYEIDEVSFDYNVSITLTTPLTEPEIDPSTDTIFTWSTSPSPDESSLFIYLINEFSPSIPNSTLVYRADGISGQSHTIDAGDVSFIPGARYQWHVASRVPLGLKVSDPATFTVQGSPPLGKPCGPLTESAKLLGPGGGYDIAELGYDVAVDDIWVAAGSPVYKDSLPIAGRVEIYKQDGSIWRHHQTIMSPTPLHRDTFGTAVDIDGNYMVVGAAYARDVNDSAGLAFIFELVNDEWVYMQTLAPDDAMAGEPDHFGISAEISGSRVLVGAPWYGQNGAYSGSAYLYELDQGVWDQTHQFFPSADGFMGDQTNGDNFGWSVSIDGDRVAIGSYDDEVEDGVDSGSVSTFELDGISWASTGKLFRLYADGGRDNDWYGSSVSVSGDSLVVGAPQANGAQGSDSGIVFAYDWGGMQWGAPQVLDVMDNGSRLGYSVVLQDGILIAGADRASGQDGEAVVFRRTGAVWEFGHDLVRTDADSPLMQGSRYGNAVDVDAGIVVGGATYADTVPGVGNSGRGAAYIHEVTLCPADLNGDGVITFFDMSIYLQLEQVDDPAADWNCNGTIDYFDVNAFLADYNAGCP